MSKSQNNITLGNEVFFYIRVACLLIYPKGSIMLFQKLRGTNVYKGSLFPATINLQNSLPPKVITQPNLKGFKVGLDSFCMNWFINLI